MNGSNTVSGSPSPLSMPLPRLLAGATAEGLLPGYVRQRDPVFLEDVMRRYVSKRRVNARVNAELEEHVYGSPKPDGRRNEAEERVKVWRETRAPANPWDARLPPRNKRATD